MSDESPPIPIRGPNSNMEEGDTEEEGSGGEDVDGARGGAGDGAGGKEPQMSLADLIPKVDIR